MTKVKTRFPDRHRKTQRRRSYGTNNGSRRQLIRLKQRTRCNPNLLTNGKFQKEKEAKLTKIKRRTFGLINRFNGIPKKGPTRRVPENQKSAKPSRTMKHQQRMSEKSMKIDEC
ncbi:unnamed protein product [Caenorhabditis nigoni]